MAKCQFHIWTNAAAPAEGVGFRSHGVAGPGRYAAPDSQVAVPWHHPVQSRILAGTYAEVAHRLPDALSQRPQAAVILFAHGKGMEDFLRAVSPLLRGLPVAGGASARTAGSLRGETLPEAQDVLLWLIDEGTWKAETINTHQATGEIFEFEGDGPRRILRLRAIGGPWMSAAAAYRDAQQRHGIAASDCESLALADDGGRNLHCGIEGEALLSGCNLPAPGSRLALGRTSADSVASSLNLLGLAPQTIVFGCAGLSGLLRTPVLPAHGSAIAFMFGEVVTLQGEVCFGNLMISALHRL